MRLSVICCAFASWAAGENTQNILADTIEAVRPLPCIQMWDNELNRLIPQKHCPPPPPPPPCENTKEGCPPPPSPPPSPRPPWPIISNPCWKVRDVVLTLRTPSPGPG